MHLGHNQFYIELFASIHFLRFLFVLNLIQVVKKLYTDKKLRLKLAGALLDF